MCTKPIHRNNLASNLFISFVVFLFFFSIPTQAEDVSSTTEVFSDQWLFGKQSSDIHPDGGDGFITFADWAVFANAWQSTSEPLSAHWNPQCDIAPDGGDGTVDMLDLARFLKYWLSEGILITSPIPNELWAKGRTYQIEWTTDNPSPTVKVRLFKGETKVLDIKNPTENNGVCNWKVPTNLSKGTNYRVKIVCVDDKTVYGFSNYFEICGRCDLYNEIMVTEPNDNFVWEMGNTYPIRWTGGESNQKVKIQLFKGSTLKKTITDSTANYGIYNY